MYFNRGSLPWQGLKAKDKKEKYKKIAEKKMSTPVEVLCKHFPAEFVTYINYCRSLHFGDKPNYSYLRRLFRELFFRKGYAADHRFDWIKLNYEQKEKRELKKKKDKRRSRLDKTSDKKEETDLKCNSNSRDNNCRTHNRRNEVSDANVGMKNLDINRDSIKRNGNSKSHVI
jgi:hypothetical protein